MSQSYRWTSIKFIGNVEYRSKGEGGGEKRSTRGGGNKTNGGKDVGGIFRPLNPPPSSPLPLDPWPTFPTDFSYTH